MDDSVKATPKRPTRRPGFRLVAPFFFAGLLIAGVGLVIKRSLPGPPTASEVRAGLTVAVLQGAWLGPFKVKADGRDDATGTLLRFTATTDQLIVTAERATIDVNPATDTIGFDLERVVIVRVPEERDSNADEADDSSLVSRERYVLGPFPYPEDIAVDPPNERNRSRDPSPEKRDAGPALVDQPADH